MLKPIRKFEKWMNIEGTGARQCSCSHGLDHWTRYSGEPTPVCSELGCRSLAAYGTHMVRVLDDREEFIVPLCRLHHVQVGIVLELRKTIAVAARPGVLCVNGDKI